MNEQMSIASLCSNLLTYDRHDEKSMGSIGYRIPFQFLTQEYKLFSSQLHSPSLFLSLYPPSTYLWLFFTSQTLVPHSSLCLRCPSFCIYWTPIHPFKPDLNSLLTIKSLLTSCFLVSISSCTNFYHSSITMCWNCLFSSIYFFSSLCT
jgi:hypothetical protein